MSEQRNKSKAGIQPRTQEIHLNKADLAEFQHKYENYQHKRDEYFHKKHEQEISAEVFLFLVVALQVLICYGQRKYPTQFKAMSFSFLAIYPLTILYHFNELSMTSGFFILLWLCWGTRTAFLMYAAMGPPPPFSKRIWKLEAKVPEKVYTWFLVTHRICYNLVGFSFICFFFLPGPAILVIFISLYFGVLSRDCADFCTNKISNSIGYLKLDNPPDNICALCDEELLPTLEIMSGEIKKEEVKNIPIKLECGHEFHKKCILGWTIVGKKDTCPFCKEKVNFYDILPQKAWDSKRLNIWWVRCLTVMRYILVWNPIVSYSAIYFLKIFHFEPLLDSHGKPIY